MLENQPIRKNVLSARIAGLRVVTVLMEEDLHLADLTAAADLGAAVVPTVVVALTEAEDLTEAVEDPPAVEDLLDLFGNGQNGLPGLAVLQLAMAVSLSDSETAIATWVK